MINSEKRAWCLRWLWNKIIATQLGDKQATVDGVDDVEEVGGGRVGGGGDGGGQQHHQTGDQGHGGGGSLTQVGQIDR